jgi:hypothetical protein
MSSLTFSAVIQIFQANPYIYISPARAKKIKSDWKKPLPVTVRINGKPDDAWHINMMPIGKGDFYLYLHGDVRNAAGKDVGDKVIVEVAFDATYKSGPVHAMPPAFRAALKKNRAAQKAWDALIPSRQKEILRYLAMLKSKEAIARNIEKAMQVLSGKGGRFMARDW